MGLDAKKTVCGVSDHAIPKLATQLQRPAIKLKVSLAISLDRVLSSKRITKALVRLRERAGWAAPLLVAKFYHVEAHVGVLSLV